MDFFWSQTVPNGTLSSPSSCPERSIAGEPLVQFTKELIDPSHLYAGKEMLLQGGTLHSYMHGWTSFSRIKLCPNGTILQPNYIFPNVQLH
jgi:hypothetical protein